MTEKSDIWCETYTIHICPLRYFPSDRITCCAIDIKNDGIETKLCRFSIPSFFYPTCYCCNYYCAFPFSCGKIFNKSEFHLTPLGCFERENGKCLKGITPLCCFGRAQTCCVPCCFNSETLMCTPAYCSFKTAEREETKNYVRERDIIIHYCCCETPITKWKIVKSLESNSKPFKSKSPRFASNSTDWNPSYPNIQEMKISDPPGIHFVHSPPGGCSIHDSSFDPREIPWLPEPNSVSEDEKSN